MHDLYPWQPLKQRMRSTHAAGFFVPGRRIVAAREDVPFSKTDDPGSPPA